MLHGKYLVDKYDSVYATILSMSTKIVVDTSVFISALIGAKGPSRELIRRCLLGEYQPLMGTALFSEYESVMGREEILARCSLKESEIASLLAAFISVAEWTKIYYSWRPNLRDEGDNHLIELAVAGNAGIIATNNLKDFRSPELAFPNVSILKPEQIIRS
jgi:putative PIN family toxin of toxin-antitoxin system